jgi:hypothetical protein
MKTMRSLADRSPPVAASVKNLSPAVGDIAGLVTAEEDIVRFNNGLQFVVRVFLYHWSWAGIQLTRD